jgi:hypothetical protein
VRQAVAFAIDGVAERKAAEGKQDHSSEWSYMSSVSRESTIKDRQVEQQASRSVFDDVDR